VKIIAIEEHWNSAGIRDALDRLPDGARDESVAFNTMGDNQARLEDIGPGRIEAMDAAAAAELERCATQLGHVGAMIHGRTGSRPLDDPAYDDLFATAARWR
jgi:hypothetical protein